MIISRTSRGQVAMEYVLSLLGVVVFFGVILRVWMWTNSTLMRRQHSFQTTRVEAGTSGGDSGKAVPYVEEPIRLFGLPGTVGGGSGMPPGGGGGGPADCPMRGLYNVYIGLAEAEEQRAANLLAGADAGADHCVPTSPETVDCTPGSQSQAGADLEAAATVLQAKDAEIAQAQADIANYDQLLLNPLLTPAQRADYQSLRAQRQNDLTRYQAERLPLQAEVDRLNALVGPLLQNNTNLLNMITMALNTARQYRDLAAALCPDD
jgi:hypothetical protein